MYCTLIDEESLPYVLLKTQHIKADYDSTFFCANYCSAHNLPILIDDWRLTHSNLPDINYELFVPTFFDNCVGKIVDDPKATKKNFLQYI